MGSFLNPYNLLECHFNWDIRLVVGEIDITNKLCEKNEEIFGQPWRNILISLTTAYEMFVKNDSGATEKLQEAILMWGSTNDEFTLKYKDAFRHVIYSLKLFFMKDSSSKSIIEEIFDYIPPFSSLPKEQQVAITAFKAHVFSEYGPKGTKHALLLAKEAVRNNPNEGEWSFLVGKMLTRIRNFNFDHFVTEEEIECFRHSYAMLQTPAHAVFLAQVYSVLAKALFEKLPTFKGRKVMNENEMKIIKGYNEKAYKLFNEACQKNDNKCAHTSFRCAKGLFHLPGEFKNLPKALELIEKNLERAPTNVFGNTIASKIYCALNLYDKAFKHAEVAAEGGSKGAAFILLQMKIDLKKQIDTEKEYEAILKKYPEKCDQIQTCMHAISYYIFKKRNIFRALKYFFKAADFDATLDEFFYYVYWIREHTDLCFLIYNEVKSAADEGKSKNFNDLKKLRDATTIICTKYPKVTEKTLNPKLVDFLFTKQKRYPKKNDDKRTYNRNKEYSENLNKKEDKNMNKNKGNKSYKNKPKRQINRSRNNSESGNGSDTSGCSFASTESFTKLRRNSRDSSIINIVTKDLELKNRCQEFKESADNSKVTSLRPCNDRNLPLVGFGNKAKTSLSMGCSGWNTKPKNDDLSKVNKMFDNMKLNDTKSNFRRNRKFSSNEKEKFNEKNQVQSADEFSTNISREKKSASLDRSNTLPTNDWRASNKQLPKERNQIAGNDKRKLNKNTVNNTEIIYASKAQVRRPFNLRRSDSLDSDDSVSQGRSSSIRSLDRLSVSSVEDDRVANKSYFPWNLKGKNNK